MMKTDITMHVVKRNSAEDMNYQREYYDFSKQV